MNAIDLNELSWRLMVVMGHFLWEGAAIGLAAMLVTMCMRGASAAARHRVLVFAIIAMGIAPVMTWGVISHSAARSAKTAIVSQSVRMNAGGVVARSSESQMRVHPTAIASAKPQAAEGDARAQRET